MLQTALWMVVPILVSALLYAKPWRQWSMRQFARDASLVPVDDRLPADVPPFILDVVPASCDVFNGMTGERRGLRVVAFDVDASGLYTKRRVRTTASLLALKRPAFHDGLPHLPEADVYDKGGWTIVVTPSQTSRLLTMRRRPSPPEIERIWNAMIDAALQSPDTNDDAHILRPRHETFAERKTRARDEGE